MRSSTVGPVALFVLLSCFLVPTATAQGAGAAGSLSHPEDVPNVLRRIRERGAQKDSLFAVSPLGWLHDSTTQAKRDLYDATGIELGFTLNHMFQGLSDALPGEDRWGTTTWVDLVGSWALIDKGQPTQGQFFVDLQGRWDYGTTGPAELGPASLGSQIETADGFSRYDPTFIFRQYYWHQGSPEAGWSYRLGKITVDAIPSSSAHLSPLTTFLPLASVGAFAIALPDSGMAAVGTWHVNDRIALMGLVSDANADRYNAGDLGAGDFFKAVELQVKVAPRTPKAGYSKLTLWQTDGTKDGQAINGQRGPSGWGLMGKLEQELSADGRAIGILRYGKSFNDSALYEQQASAHFLLYDPPLGHLRHDLIGVGFNWLKVPQSGTRSEYDVEVFYRFPIFPHVDTTLAYQSVINPALDLGINHASVFSLRIQASF
jgi:hypothetical protein